jgi:hypothetical protein
VSASLRTVDPDSSSPGGGPVVTLRRGGDVVTAIERFSLDGSEQPALSDESPEDLSTVTHLPDETPGATTDRPGTTRAADHLRSVVARRNGFLGGLLLAGHDGELVLYSQWRATRSVPTTIPEEWSLTSVLDDAVRVDARTYVVDFTAPGLLNRASRATTPHAHFGVFTVPPEAQEQMLALARRHAPDSLGTPGLAGITFHRSLDGRRVVNLGLWRSFDAFEKLLARPGFTGGGEYWAGVAGFRPHYFDVAAVVSG